MRGLAGKVALVTGAGGGIGAAICERLAEEGCHVALFDRDADAARAAGEKVQALGRRASTHVVDITDYEAVAEAVACVAKRPWFRETVRYSTRRRRYAGGCCARPPR